jgi:hypothetical protein
MTGGGDESTSADWIKGIAVVVALLVIAILIVVAVINAQCNCLTPA